MAACAALTLIALPTTFAQAPNTTVAAPAGSVQLPGHVPALVNSSALLGPVPAAQPVSLALTLPLRDQRSLETLIYELYDVNSPQMGHFLTPPQFAARFGPTQADYDAVVQYAQAKGLTVTRTTPSRTLLDVTGTAATVQAAFGLHLLRYRDPSGREFYAPDADPTVDANIAGKIAGVIGLDTAAIARPGARPAGTVRRPANIFEAFAGESPSTSSGSSGGSGSSGSAITLNPAGVRQAYNLSGVPQTGAGQSVALFEADGYNLADITAYENNYGLPHLNPQNIQLDGASAKPSSANEPGPGLEDVLDIEMVLSLAPNVSNIYVYIVPPTPTGYMDGYNQIAWDNTAREVSTSWSFGNEAGTPRSLVDAENRAFAQMNAQGQTMFAASGDNAAYADGSTLSVQDPASQPYVCAVGGTTLSVDGYGNWASETTWRGTMPTPNTLYKNAGGSGGGNSVKWPAPYYQSQPNVDPGAALGSYQYRNVPDVSLDADPNTGYYVYYNGSLIPGVGGTSAASPLWAAFTALVNQQRAANGYVPCGLISQLLYQIETGQYGNYAADFHDIADNSDNFYFPAIPGYDLATGLGSFNGANLLADLVDRPGANGETFPLYRLYNSSTGAGTGGYLYTVSPSEYRSSVEGGYRYDFVQCHVYNAPHDAPNLIPLYRLHNVGGDHLYTTSAAERQSLLGDYGWEDQSVACYVFGDASFPNTVPLYRAYYNGEHFYTKTYSEYVSHINAGATGEGIACYVLP